ncbi:MAG: hypothetical protein LN409_04840, partial [Candidatus Thermoplasmatota archaeon]|nr:hypothetical protein [Candidatus Thermoplasmatota archaeon]
LIGMVSPRQTGPLTFLLGIGGIVAGSLILAWVAFLRKGKESPLLGAKGYLAVRLGVSHVYNGWLVEDASPWQLVGAVICGIGLLLSGFYVIALHL